MSDLFSSIGALIRRLVDTGETYDDGTTEHDVYSPVVDVRDGLYHSRRGETWRCWVNDFVPGAAERVLELPTQTESGGSGVALPVAEGRDYYITGFDYGVHTASDNCTFTLGYTDAVGGAGTFTQAAIPHHIFTGATIAGWMENRRQFNIPIRIRYADGARSIAVRVDANDGATEICVGHSGFWETAP